MFNRKKGSKKRGRDGITVSLRNIDITDPRKKLTEGRDLFTVHATLEEITNHIDGGGNGRVEHHEASVYAIYGNFSAPTNVHVRSFQPHGMPSLNFGSTSDDLLVAYVFPKDNTREVHHICYSWNLLSYLQGYLDDDIAQTLYAAATDRDIAKISLQEIGSFLQSLYEFIDSTEYSPEWDVKGHKLPPPEERGYVENDQAELFFDKNDRLYLDAGRGVHELKPKKDWVVKDGEVCLSEQAIEKYLTTSQRHNLLGW